MSAAPATGLTRFTPRNLRLWRQKNRHLTLRRLLNVLLVRVEMKLGRTHLYSRPYQLCIDVSNKCNLTCPFCPTGRREVGRGKGNISYETFKEIVDELAPTAITLSFYNWGEPFFNPDLARLIAHAHRKRLVTLISSNMSFKLKDEQVRDIIRSGLMYLTASIDGADQQSYEVYRRGGKFKLALENLRTFVRLKKEMKSEFPVLCWQYLIFAHNEDKVEEARRLAAELGIDRFSATGGLYEDASWAPKGEYKAAYLELHHNRCRWLWTKAVFHWDGGMASCCMGFYKHDDFADWSRGRFAKMWNNEKFIAARRIWTEPKSPLPEGHYCTDCDKVRFYRGLPMRSVMRPVAELREASGE